MRFGIFYEHQLPRPWDAGDERTLLNNALEQVEIADRVGVLEPYERRLDHRGAPTGDTPHEAVKSFTPERSGLEPITGGEAKQYARENGTEAPSPPGLTDGSPAGGSRRRGPGRS